MLSILVMSCNIMSCNFMSCNFMPCNFDGPSFACPSFSAPPRYDRPDYVLLRFLVILFVVNFRIIQAKFSVCCLVCYHVLTALLVGKFVSVDCVHLSESSILCHTGWPEKSKPSSLNYIKTVSNARYFSILSVKWAQEYYKFALNILCTT